MVPVGVTARSGEPALVAFTVRTKFTKRRTQGLAIEPDEQSPQCQEEQKEPAAEDFCFEWHTGIVL